MIWFILRVHPNSRLILLSFKRLGQDETLHEPHTACWPAILQLLLYYIFRPCLSCVYLAVFPIGPSVLRAGAMFTGEERHINDLLKWYIL